MSLSDTNVQVTQSLGKGVRKKFLSTKARETQEQKLEYEFVKLANNIGNFNKNVYEELKAHCCSKFRLQEISTYILEYMNPIESIYNQLKDVSTASPDRNVRQDLDRLVADRAKIAALVEGQLKDITDPSQNSTCEEAHSTRGSSVHKNTASKLASAKDSEDDIPQLKDLMAEFHKEIHHTLSQATEGTTSSNIRKAAASLRTRQAELASQIEENRLQEELSELEFRIAKQKRIIKLRKLDNLVKMEAAKLKAYSEVGTEPTVPSSAVEEHSELSYRARNFEIEPSSPHHTRNKTEPNVNSRRSGLSGLLPLEDAASGSELRDELSYHSSGRRDQASQKSNVGESDKTPPPKRSSCPTNIEQDPIERLVKVLTASIGINRLPIPEPEVFEGNPLMFKDWRISFKVLIENKGVQEEDKVHYLKQYLGGQAKEAVSSILQLNSPTAFQSAMKIIEERYGNSFVVTEAYREKLRTWSKISARDGKGLRRFSDFLIQCTVIMSEVKGLEILNDTRENRQLLQKLSDGIVLRWGRYVEKYKKKHQAYPSFAKFSDFIKEEANIQCDPITSLDSLKTEEQKKAPKMKKSQGFSTSTSSISENVTKSSSSRKCTFCEKGNHELDNCYAFMKKPLVERLDYVKKYNLCFGCLSKGHMSKKCTERKQCKKCPKKHPTCLHAEEEVKGGTSSKTSFNESSAIETNSSNCHSMQSDSSVSTMIVPVFVSTKSDPENELLVYALQDTMSDTSFILGQIAEELNATFKPVQLKVSTITSREQIVRSQRYNELLVRGFNSETRLPLPATYSREYIPVDRAHIPTPFHARRWPHLRKIANKIAPLQACAIGLLIGYNCPEAIEPLEVISGSKGRPHAVHTRLGWSIVGSTECREDSGDAIGTVNRIITTEVPVNLHIPMLADSEGEDIHTNNVTFACQGKVKELIVPPKGIVNLLEADFNDIDTKDSMISQDDYKFLQLMKEGITQDKHGYYSVPLPFKDRPHLPNNKIMALNRLSHLKRKLQSNQEYWKEYSVFMDDMIKKGDAEPVQRSQTDGSIWYIPHHAVYHPRKPGKLRIVFDCSAKYHGRSLNDHLLQGPDQMNSLLGVLCRFRHEEIAISCDIERMFYNFLVPEADRDFLRFLWFTSQKMDEICEYRMRVHIFGATSSPGCANYCLRAIATDYGKDLQKAANCILSNFYVDDGLLCVSTTSEAIKLISDLQSLCAKANVRIHKFASNSREVLKALPQSEVSKSTQSMDLSLNSLPVERVLGVEWCLETDAFQFRLSLKNQPDTRRGILSTIATVYDPLGFIAPFLVRGKAILQEMCRSKLDWDEPISNRLSVKWKEWLADLPAVSGIQVPRYFKPGIGAAQTYELHHFADASTCGYGQCSYVRLVSTDGEVTCYFVIGKARVAPLKTTTIPRLELQAAVVATKASRFLRRELSIPNITEYFWTDSKVVLGYINNESRRFHIYVANRVQFIRSHTSPNQWRYIPTKENPADIASRGLRAKEIASSRWLTGPEFLWRTQLMLPDAQPEQLSPKDPEVRQVFAHTTTENSASLLERLKRYSDWLVMIKSIAWLKKTLLRLNGVSVTDVSVDDIHNAELTIITLLQENSFPKEIERLKMKLPLMKGSQLFKLCPFLDENGLLRIGGRLAQANSLDYGLKHPMILPRHGHVTESLIRHYHKQVQHQGRGITVNHIRSKGYWIVGCSKAVSSIIYKCVTCRRLRGTTLTQLMADLPQERVEPSAPFTYIACDCFGPFIVQEGRKDLKRYGLIFTCMASRAVHIEVLDAMTTDAFINGLRCLIAIRGPVRQIRCDNGSNFVGAQAELKKALEEVKDTKIKQYLKNQNCDFTFNPPSASHMNGVCERMIRTVRSILNCMANQFRSRLDNGSLRTFCYEAMAIINSRPLTTETLHDQSLMPITPNQLLTMKTTLVLPPPGKFVEADVFARKRWRRVQYLANQFWLRWRKDYLNAIQPRQKWTNKQCNVSIGDVVVICDDSECFRGHWRLARVESVKVSNDGLVRSARLLISNGNLDKNGKSMSPPSYLERPIHKLKMILSEKD